MGKAPGDLVRSVPADGDVPGAGHGSHLTDRKEVRGAECQQVAPATRRGQGRRLLLEELIFLGAQPSTLSLPAAGCQPLKAWFLCQGNPKGRRLSHGLLCLAAGLLLPSTRPIHSPSSRLPPRWPQAIQRATTIATVRCLPRHPGIPVFPICSPRVVAGKLC